MRRILLTPIGGIVFVIMTAIPGALVGLVTGLLGFHKFAAIAGGIIFFITYPLQRRLKGLVTDALTYFLALCGGIGGGLACYFVGNLVQWPPTKSSPKLSAT